jgi:hypothetical protein
MSKVIARRNNIAEQAKGLEMTPRPSTVGKPSRQPPPVPPPTQPQVSVAPNFTTVSTSADSLGFKSDFASKTYVADLTKNNQNLQDNRINFLQNMPARLKVIIDNLDKEPNFTSSDKKTQIDSLRSDANKKLEAVWPRINTSGESELIKIGGKRTRRTRPSSNKTKRYKKRNQYKR